MEKFKKSKTIKNLTIFIKKNPPLSIFLLIAVLTILVGASKYSSQKSDYIYTKLKLSQGYWWVNTQKPSVWQANAFKNKEISQSDSGVEEILSVRMYPRKQGDFDNSNEKFDIYLVAKLSVKSNKFSRYTRKREDIAIGSPIELSLPLSDVTATVIDISELPFESEYKEKIVELVGIEEYRINEEQIYESIQIGDTYHDGHEVVFEIIDKTLQPIVNEVNYSTGISRLIKSNSVKNIILTAKMKVLEKDNKLIFGEEQIMITGGKLDISTQNTDLSSFFIGKISDSEN